LQKFFKVNQLKSAFIGRLLLKTHRLTGYNYYTRSGVEKVYNTSLTLKPSLNLNEPDHCNNTSSRAGRVFLKRQYTVVFLDDRFNAVIINPLMV